jgi:hypothetical protein
MKRSNRFFRLISAGAPLAAALSFPILAHAANLSIGADYLLRGVAITERDNTITDNQYYDQRLSAYLITDLSKDVEATIRIQSLTPWGLEGSTSSALATRYPDANGGLWVQNAFVRLPRIWKERIVLTLGRQPILWGDGAILSDDDLGFNALRAQVRSPFRFLPIDVDAFTAKVNEGMRTPTDIDVSGVLVGFDRDAIRWELMMLGESNESPSNYEMGSETSPVNASKIKRQIMGVRARTNLKDAYLTGEYYRQTGNVTRAPNASDITLGGDAYLIGLGGKNNTKFGRFGALLEYAVGSGDDVNSAGEDEAFRPTYASRWSGLERRGYGRYFGASFADAYSPTNPFAPADSVNDGLPAGTSGIQTIRFGIESTPWSQWTFLFDYFQFKAQKNLVGPKELGTEFDYGVEYRYSGLVTFRAFLAQFRAGDAYTTTPIDTRRNATLTSAEVEVKF